MRELAPAKINLCLCVGRRRADGRHELLSVMAVDHALRRARVQRRASATRSVCPGVEGPNLASAALAAFRAAPAGTGRRQRIEILKRIPVAAGMGGGSADAAAAPAAARPALGHGRRRCAARASPRRSARTSPASCARVRGSSRGAGEQVSRARRSGSRSACWCCPRRPGSRPPPSIGEADRLGAGRTPAELAALDPLAADGSQRPRGGGAVARAVDGRGAVAGARSGRARRRWSAAPARP